MRPSDLIKIVILTIILLGVEVGNKAYIDAYYPPRSIIPFSVLVYKWFGVFLVSALTLFLSNKMMAKTESDSAFLVGLGSLFLLILLELSTQRVCGGAIILLFLNIVPITAGTLFGIASSR